MVRVVGVIVVLGLITSVAAGETTKKKFGYCANDMKHYVQAGVRGCFALDVVGHPDFEPSQPLVVFMHGDSGALRDGKYFRSYRAQFRRLERKGVNVLAIARPAYRLPHARTTGIVGRFNSDPYTIGVVDGLAGALKALKAH